MATSFSLLSRLTPRHRSILFGVLALLAPVGPLLGADSARQVIVNAIVEEEGEKRVELSQLHIVQMSSNEAIKPLLAAWDADQIYIYQVLG